MEQPWLGILIAAAFLIIAGLSFYAGRLLFLLKKQKEKQQKAEQAFVEKIQQRRQFQQDSIRTIAKAVVEEQCELSEGAIRICVLLDNAAAREQAFASEYPSFYQLYNNIKSFPTHEARKELSKKERMRQDMQRWNWEGELKDGMLAEAEKLKQFEFILN
ncbi:DUF2489 domain-containing protein [Catenovulum sp. SM1970]|nr:DUF2489 domain-containing protein [Marinifaba aquimaris]